MTNTTFVNTTFTNGTALPATACVDESIVIWQSALWALLALALNAMTQPSAADPSPTPAISLARSSPLICFLDAISIPIWLSVGCFYNESATNSLASKRIATRRDHLTAPRAPIFSPTTGAVFFILGPLPQAIKLAGMSGVPFTQIIGFIFLFAYLVGVYEANAIHRATLRQVEKPWLPFAVKAQRIPETVRYRLTMTIDVLRFFAYGVHFGLWLSVAHMMVYTSKDAEKSNLERLLVSAVMLYYQYPILLVALPAGLYAKTYLGNWLHERFSGSVGTHRMRPVLNAGLLYGPSVLCSFSAFALVIFLFQLLKNHFSYKQERRLAWKAYTDTKESFVKLSGFLLVAFVLLICIPLLTIMIFVAKSVVEQVIAPEPEISKPELEKEETGDDGDGDGDTARSMAVLGFGLSNLLFAVLFYANVYDAKGTSKSGWSEMLG